MNWLRLFLRMFYAPGRALEEVCSRPQLAAALLLSLLGQSAFTLYTQGPLLQRALGVKLLPVILVLFISGGSIFLTALIYVPATIWIANLFERRGSFGLVIQQEFSPAASALFYAWAAANLAALPVAFIARASGFVNAYINFYQGMNEQLRQENPDLFKLLNPPNNPVELAVVICQSFVVPFSIFFTLLALRKIFRLSWPRTLAVGILSSIVFALAARLLMSAFGMIIGSPFLLIILFFILRGYFNEVMSAQRARASFRRNLEAATLNPADASAHYNLGFIHQQRGELAEARQRFMRAIEIDPEEIDAHYQLGRIARAEGRLPEAIGHFEQVVSRDQSHAQHEIWREIGATYLEASQFADARDALERFLEHRPSDPQGLYLMGRAHAGLGHAREAASSMQACIEAVKTAPAYKYRTEKRWLNEAQQFLRSQQV